MPQFLAGRQLVFGVIALQNSFISREQLVTAFDAWVHEKTKSLPEVLVAHGALSSSDRDLLERLVSKFLERHGDDPERSLANLSSADDVVAELTLLGDPQLEASLRQLASEPRDPNVLPPTIVHPRFNSDFERGRFRILRHHAEGGLGQVSVALDQELNREVALKEIKPRHADDPANRERFVLEAEITGALEHPGIVPVYALGHSASGRPFYAMRFVKGDSLKAAIEAFHGTNSGRGDAGTRLLELRRLLARFIDVCNAMEYAHSRGVLHRDLKPGNIMVGRYGETLVVDWGLAKVCGRKDVSSSELSVHPRSPLSSSGETRPGSVIGTPAYMSPEQARGDLESLGPATDVYSLGATLYHLLCGRPPFEKGEHVEIVARVQSGDYSKPRAIVADVPQPLENICLKAMALNASDRYRSARGLADDLEHWLADEPVSAHSESMSARIARWSRKHRGWVQAGSIAVLGLLLVTSTAAVVVDAQRKQVSKLATEKGLLAEERGKLADSNRALFEAEKQARQSIGKEQMAKAEEARKLAAQLRLSNMLRLAAQAQMERPRSPQCALLLSLEAMGSTDKTHRPPEVLQSLIQCLANVSGQGIPRGTPLFSPDSQQLAVGSRLYDLNDTNLSRSINLGHDAPIEQYSRETQSSKWSNQWQPSGTPLRFTPGGRRLITKGTIVDGSIEVWNVHEADPLTSIRILTPDGRILSVPAALSERSNRLPEKASVDVPPKESIKSPTILLSTSGRFAASSNGRLWDLDAMNLEEASRDCRLPAGESILAISSDGQWVATRTVRGGLIRRTLQTDPKPSRELFEERSLYEWEATARSAWFSPDSRWLLAIRRHDTGIPSLFKAALFDLQSGAAPELTDIMVFGDEGPKRDRGPLEPMAQFSEDSSCLVIHHTFRALVWRLTGLPDQDDKRPRTEPPVKLPVLMHVGSISSPFVSPDGWTLAGYRADTIHVWNLRDVLQDTIKLLRQKRPDDTSDREPMALTGHSGPVRDLVFSRTSQKLVSASDDGTVRCWSWSFSLPSSNILRGHDRQVERVVSSPDGNWIATESGDGTSRVWQVVHGRAEKGVSPPPRPLRASPRTLTDPLPRETVKCAGIAHTGTVRLVCQENEIPHRLAVRSIVVADGPEDRVRRHELGRHLIFFEGHVACSRDGSQIVALDSSTLKVWDLDVDGTPKMIFQTDVKELPRERVSSLCLDDAGTRVLVTDDTHGIRVWDLRDVASNRGPRQIANDGDRVTSAQISGDGRWAAAIYRGESKGARGLIRIWDLDSTGKHPRELLSPFLAEAKAEPKGQIDTTRSQMCFAPGGRSLAISSEAGSLVGVLDLKVRAQNAETILQGLNSPMNALAYSSDGKYLAAADTDGAIRLWDVSTSNPGKQGVLLRDHADSPTVFVAFSSDGNRLVSVDADGGVLVWTLDETDLVRSARIAVGRALSPDERQGLGSNCNRS